MANTTHVRGARPGAPDPGERNAPVDTRPLVTRGSGGSGLREAALQVDRLIARVDPRQLTAADRQCLRQLLDQLSSLARLTC